jgi:hypothetical protein
MKSMRDPARFTPTFRPDAESSPVSLRTTALPGTVVALLAANWVLAIASNSTVPPGRAGQPTDTTHDARDLSFRLSPPWRSARPAGDPWIVDPLTRCWVRAYRLHILGGFHGWETGGFAWTDATVVLDAQAREPVFLNVAIAGRYRRSKKPVVIEAQGRRYTFDLNGTGRSFSLPLQTAPNLIRVKIRDAAGALSPAEMGESGDARKLALRLTRPSLDDNRRFRFCAQIRHGPCER